MIEWFRHDTDARNDIKIRKLLRDSDPGSLGAYWMCIEMIYQAGGYAEEAVIKEELSFYNMDKFVPVLVEYGLLEDVGNGVLTSQRVLSEIAYWEQTRQKKSDAGKKGMASRWGKRDNSVISKDNSVIDGYNTSYQSITPDNTRQDNTRQDNIPPSVSKETSSPKGDTAPKKAAYFIPPTVEEVRAYCQERQNNVDPETFVDFYTSKNWMVGKTKMKDWKASVRTWEKDRNPSKTERNDFYGGKYIKGTDIKMDLVAKGADRSRYTNQPALEDLL